MTALLLARDPRSRRHPVGGGIAVAGPPASTGPDAPIRDRSKAPRYRRGRWLVGGLLAATAGLGSVLAGPASAHPLGNFTVNRYAGLQVATDQLAVDYVVDRAEIPTFQARDQIDRDHDGRLSTAEFAAYGGSDCRSAAEGLQVTAGGRAVPVRVVTGTAALRPGQAGLPTLRTACRLASRLPDGAEPTTLTVRDVSDAGRIGWHEMTAIGDGTTVSGLPSRSVSDRLTAYPAGMLRAPLDVRQASVRVVPGGPRLAAVTGHEATSDQPAARGLDPLSRRFTELVGRQRLTVGFALLAVALATVLGGLHAFAPGHGKTVMAAFIVDGRGGLRAITTIGLTVTATHTLGVLLLGVVVSTSASLASERVLPALGAVSGAMLATVGIGLLLGARRRSSRAPDPVRDAPHDHEHAHANDPVGASGHDHDAEHAHGHRHAPSDGAAAAPAPHRHGFVTHSHLPSSAPVGTPRRRTLVTMGLAGGLVPSPSALVVLLGAVALHRAWFGVLLVACYGLGMAATMTGIGLGLSRARGAMTAARWRGHNSVAVAERLLPVATAGIITVVGLSLALRAVGTAFSLG